MVRVEYLTDPACPEAWALEPARRRLEHEFAGELSIRWVMAGLWREVRDAQAIAVQWLEAAARSGMPVDVRLWLSDPPRSSYPACMAVCAAAEQGDPGAYLRRLREGFAVGRRRLDTADALVCEAAGAGLDAERLRIDLASHAILERFDADLRHARSYGAKDTTPALPTLVFVGEDGAEHVVRGARGYDELRATAEAAGASTLGSDGAQLAVEAALERHGPLATAEIAALCALPGPRAAAALWAAATEWRVRVIGELAGAQLWARA